MVHPILRFAALAAALIMCVSCQDSRTPTSPSQVTAAPLPPTTFPDVVQPARIFVAADSGRSRYVLYDEGKFALQYLYSLGSWHFPGTYKEVDGQLTFTFDGDGWSIAGQPDARGVLEGDSLTVSYNVIMQLSDFENGVYVRIR